MKLVSARSRLVVELADISPPPYAVLSHTRDSADQEPVYSPLNTHYRPSSSVDHHRCCYDACPSSHTTTTATTSHPDPDPPASPPHPPFSHGPKLDRACEHALESGLEYIWIDALCIDKTSTADLDDAVNGSRRRLRNATVCFAYLHDLPEDDDVELDNNRLWSQCRYWTRAWTLQELLLSPRVEFYDRKWNYRGAKDSPELAALLSGITGIPRSILMDSRTIPGISLAVRISWSVGRVAVREEDTVYALVSITGATLPVRYGEGAERAFLRLQEELLRDNRDGSLLAWRSARDGEVRGLLARSPSEFGHFAPAASAATSMELLRPWVFNGKVRFSSKGIEVQSRVCQGPGCLLLSIGQKRHSFGTTTTDSSSDVAICFRECNGVYVRVAPASKVPASAMHTWRTIDVARDVDHSESLSLRRLFNSMPYRLDIAKQGNHGSLAWPRQQQQQQQPQQQGQQLQPQQQAAMSKVRQSRDQQQAGQHYRDKEAQEDKDDKDDDSDMEMKLEANDNLVTLTPTISYPTSNTSDGSFVNIASISAWNTTTTTSLHHQQQPEEETAAPPPLPSCDLDQDDIVCSPESEMDSWTSNSASASAGASFCGSEYYGYDDDNASTADTRSITTVAADTEDGISSSGGGTPLDRLIRQSSFQEKLFQEKLFNTAYKRVCDWIPEVQHSYVVPAQDRLPPQSRINTDSSMYMWPSGEALYQTPFSSSDCYSSETNTKTQSVDAFCPAGFFHLACPFRAANHQQHDRCLLDADGDLQNMSDVLEHVSKRHALLPYCAFCHQDFSHPEERDAHMNLRTCPNKGFQPSRGGVYRKGVGADEKRELDKLDARHTQEGEAKRWLRIFAALFPDLDEREHSIESAAAGPYLRDSAAFVVSLVHDFWTLGRDECVASVLKDYGRFFSDMNCSEKFIETVCSELLHDLIQKVYTNHSSGQEDA